MDDPSKKGTMACLYGDKSNKFDTCRGKMEFRGALR